MWLVGAHGGLGGHVPHAADVELDKHQKNNWRIKKKKKKTRKEEKKICFLLINRCQKKIKNFWIILAINTDTRSSALKLICQIFELSPNKLLNGLREPSWVFQTFSILLYHNQIPNLENIILLFAFNSNPYCASQS